MPGNAELGALLRDMRRARQLTLAAVARKAGCAESLVSYVETGRRQAQPWLLNRLDAIYQSGGAITALANAFRPSNGPAAFTFSDTLVVDLPEGGVSMPISRRDLLAFLGFGIGSGTLTSQLDSALTTAAVGENSLQTFEAAYTAFQSFARTMPAHQLIDGMIGKVAVLDSLRRRARGRQRQQLGRMQARYAESLSWLSEESGDLAAAMYWIDRASQWGHTANWPEMATYSIVRRSMVAISFANDGSRAVDIARDVMAIRDTSPRLQGLAAKQMAFGYALTGNADASARSLDDAMALLAKPMREEDAVLGQRSVVDEDLFTVFRTTCDIYLGRGQRVVPILEPRLASLSASSARTATITRAKLARAYANAGQPHEATRIAHEALDDIERVGSLSARSELRRAVPVLQQWHGHDDVHTVLERIAATA